MDALQNNILVRKAQSGTFHVGVAINAMRYR